ncbi:hypothetical protein V6N12_073013 [Hibiscus sabdariffa]|uniref:Uncharacterized protein n=1 Tax=Hibiscus sabdariffa TaxID=183260 RepID=A0ABR2AZL1_9ROSI
MVIPPTIWVAPKSLLMEMFKKSEDNDTWKLDDFKFVIRTTVNIDLPAQVPTAAYYLPMCMPKFLSQHISCPTSCHGILPAQIPVTAYILPNFLPRQMVHAQVHAHSSCHGITTRRQILHSGLTEVRKGG